MDKVRWEVEWIDRGGVSGSGEGSISGMVETDRSVVFARLPRVECFWEILDGSITITCCISNGIQIASMFCMFCT